MTGKPRLLDLYCGAGGAAMGYHWAGFEVVGVDIEPQPNYPFEFIQMDALLALKLVSKVTPNCYAVIHASPPCQAFTAMGTMPNAGKHRDLLTPTRECLKATGIPYVIENVPGAPMDDVRPVDLFGDGGGVMLCGSMFGLNNGTYELRRHRLFECSSPLEQPPCRHKLPVVGFYGDHARVRQRIEGFKDRGRDILGGEKIALVRDLMGIDWMAWTEATQAIPPAYTEWIGGHLLSSVVARDRDGV